MSTTSDALLHAEAISVRFGGVQALDAVSLEARTGQITALIGPNGAGKSTMLGCISGTIDQDSGSIRIGEVDITRMSPQQRASLGMARTFQSPQLIPELTIREHVVLAQRTGRQARSGRGIAAAHFVGDLVPFLSHGVRSSELVDADVLLAELGLSGVAKRGPLDLPLGMRRLVEVAICLATNAQVMLMDEPSAGLDREETMSLAKVITTLAAERGIAIVLVEHDLELVLSVSSQIYVLDFGKLIDSGTPSQISASEAVQAAYLGTAEAS